MIEQEQGSSTDSSIEEPELFEQPEPEIYDGVTPRRARPSARFVIAVFAIGAVVAAVLLWPLPYYSIGPGLSEPVEPLMKVTGAPTFDHSGRLDLTTVNETSLNVAQYLIAQLDPTLELVPKQQLDGKLSSKESDELNEQMMQSSKLIASVVALRKLGYDPVITGEGSIVADVVKATPAASVLRIGDVVTAADGQPVKTFDELNNVMKTKKPGDTVQLQITRDGKSQAVTVGTTADKKDPNVARMGIAVKPYNLKVDAPVHVTIDSSGIGGPSAGLVYTLSIIQELTKDDITHGHKIAATGEIEPDGAAGEIGGIEQKVRSVEKTGAEYFLVPAENAAAAKKVATSTKVVPVHNVDEALKFLATLPQRR